MHSLYNIGKKILFNICHFCGIKKHTNITHTNQQTEEKIFQPYMYKDNIYLFPN